MLSMLSTADKRSRQWHLARASSYLQLHDQDLPSAYLGMYTLRSDPSKCFCVPKSQYLYWRSLLQ